jgi:hypothetical protein
MVFKRRQIEDNGSSDWQVKMIPGQMIRSLRKRGLSMLANIFSVLILIFISQFGFGVNFSSGKIVDGGSQLF